MGVYGFVVSPRLVCTVPYIREGKEGPQEVGR